MPNIIFYNEFHNGDIHMSRQYVKDMMDIYGPQHSYYYYHINSEKLLKDIPNIHHIRTPSELDTILHLGTHVLIPTWIGYIKNFFDGCNFAGYYALMGELYKRLGIFNNLKPIDYYVPTVDYAVFSIGNIPTYFKDKSRRHVLFCNNFTASGQSWNFDMDPMIENISAAFPEIMFIVTNKFKTSLRKNIIYAEDIIAELLENNLYEISYIATFCDTIIGRSSGPYSCAITQDTIHTKKFICICNSITDAWRLPTSTNIAWTDIYDIEYIEKFISKEIM